jgi:hypothetical protein
MKRARKTIEDRAFKHLERPSELKISALVALERTLHDSPQTRDMRAVFPESREAKTVGFWDSVEIRGEDDDYTVAEIVRSVRMGLALRAARSVAALSFATGLGWLVLSGAVIFNADLARLALYLGAITATLELHNYVSMQLLPAVHLKRTAARIGVLTPEEICDLGAVIRLYLFFPLAWTMATVAILVFQWTVVTA